MTTWYHGGIPGLTIGDVLLPPDVTCIPGTLSRYKPDVDLENIVRTDRVFLCRESSFSRMYAFAYPEGDVYTARPEGAHEEDADCLGGMSIQCERAVITGIVARRVRKIGDGAAALIQAHSQEVLA